MWYVGFLVLRGPRNNDATGAMRAQSLLFKYHPQLKEMSDSRMGAGKIQDVTYVFCAKKSKSVLKYNKDVSKEKKK